MSIQQMFLGVSAGGLNPDANGDYLVLAMPLNSDYGDADVSNEINSGSTTKTITTNGNAAASNTQYKFYDSSYYFDGTGDYLTVADNADFEFDGDFTLECFVYLTSTTHWTGFFGKRATSSEYGPFSFYTNAGATILQFVGSTNGSSWALDLNGSASYPIPINTWTHIAAARSGSTLKIFVDGYESASGTLSGTLHNNSRDVLIGAGSGDGSNLINGYLQDVRIYKGVAKYTASFTPPGSIA